MTPTEWMLLAIDATILAGIAVLAHRFRIPAAVPFAPPRAPPSGNAPPTACFDAGEGTVEGAREAHVIALLADLPAVLPPAEAARAWDALPGILLWESLPGEARLRGDLGIAYAVVPARGGDGRIRGWVARIPPAALDRAGLGPRQRWLLPAATTSAVDEACRQFPAWARWAHARGYVTPAGGDAA